MAELTAKEFKSEVDPSSELGRLLFEESADAKRDWIEHFLTVPNELGQVVPFKLYPQQFKILQDETGRDIIVKGRQTRASTILMARNLRPLVTGAVWGATFIVGAQDDATTAVFRKRFQHHIYNDLASKGFKLNIGRDNPDEIVFADFDNRIAFVSGEQRTMSRGYAAQAIHFSEFAHWKDTALELLGGALPAVPAAPFGRVVLESTPKGEQGAFYDYAMAGKPLNPNGLWSVHLYPWWLEPRYTVSTDPLSGCDIVLDRADLAGRIKDFVPNDHEARLMLEEGLNENRMIWRRLKKEEQDRTQAPFLQEYPEDLDTCWLGVQGKFFDTPDGIDHLEYFRDARRNPVKYFERLPYLGDEVSFFGNNFAIWEFPDQNDSYVCGFDTAGGGLGKDADWSVMYVMSVKKEKVVARLRVQASPKSFAAMICAVATFYKSATVNGEDDSRGRLVFQEMRELSYNNVYYYVDPLKPQNKQITLPGMYPTASNRQAILEKLKTGITNHAIESFCQELVREMNTFTWQKFTNRIRAQADINGQHDDCIFAIAYAWWIIDKVRARLQRDSRKEEEVVFSGPLGRVIRRGDGELPYGDRLWFS